MNNTVLGKGDRDVPWVHTTPHKPTIFQTSVLTPSLPKVFNPSLWEIFPVLQVNNSSKWQENELTREILFTVFILIGMMVSCWVKKQVPWMPEQRIRIIEGGEYQGFSPDSYLWHPTQQVVLSLGGCWLPTVFTPGILNLGSSDWMWIEFRGSLNLGGKK